MLLPSVFALRNAIMGGLKTILPLLSSSLHHLQAILSLFLWIYHGRRAHPGWVPWGLSPRLWLHHANIIARSCDPLPSCTRSYASDAPCALLPLAVGLLANGQWLVATPSLAAPGVAHPPWPPLLHITHVGRLPHAALAGVREDVGWGGGDLDDGRWWSRTQSRRGMEVRDTTTMVAGEGEVWHGGGVDRGDGGRWARTSWGSPREWCTRVEQLFDGEFLSVPAGELGWSWRGWSEEEEGRGKMFLIPSIMVFLKATLLGNGTFLI